MPVFSFENGRNGYSVSVRTLIQTSTEIGDHVDSGTFTQFCTNKVNHSPQKLNDSYDAIPLTDSY